MPELIDIYLKPELVKPGTNQLRAARRRAGDSAVVGVVARTFAESVAKVAGQGGEDAAFVEE